MGLWILDNWGGGGGCSISNTKHSRDEAIQKGIDIVSRHLNNGGGNMISEKLFTKYRDNFNAWLSRYYLSNTEKVKLPSEMNIPIFAGIQLSIF